MFLSPCPSRISRLLKTAVIAGACGLPLATGADATPFPTGANTLFAGNSFFIPASSFFNSLAIQNGFADHEFNSVFSPGSTGSPLALWNDDTNREAILSQLETGEVELFGLTNDNPGADSRAQDYVPWFQAAIEHNPDVEFFISSPHPTGGGTSNLPFFNFQSDAWANARFQVVQELRELFPDNPVHFLHAGEVFVEARTRLEAGDLPDIEQLLFSPAANNISLQDSLFEDVFGHGGPFVRELVGATYLAELYGADVESLTFSSDFESDIAGIVDNVLAFNEPFQIPVPEPATGALVAAAMFMAGGGRRRRASA